MDRPDPATGSRNRPRVEALSWYADYRCENTGVCCESGWDIAVEAPTEAALRERLADKSVVSRLPRSPDGFRVLQDPPTGCRSAFRSDGKVCWFRDRRDSRCAIHREFGEEALPSACRHFPRICVLEPERVTVSLSHYCPTAAGLLFRPSTRFAVAPRPAAFDPSWPFEGLDARRSHSPLLRAGVLLGWDGLRSLETGGLDLLARAPTAAQGVDMFAAAIGRCLDWRPGDISLADWVREAFARGGPSDAVSADFELSKGVDELLLASVPQGGPRLDLPSRCGEVRLPDPGAEDLALRRYLASKLFGAWITHQGAGLATLARYLRFCLATLRRVAPDDADDERARWVEAVRLSDLWLVHHCDPELLAINLE